MNRVTLIGNAGRDAEIIKLGVAKEAEQQVLSEEVAQMQTADQTSSQPSMERERREGGGEIVRFTLATNQTFRNREGEIVREAEWHNVSVFNPVLRDFASKFVKKGTKVYVEGRLRYRRFKDKEGIDRTVCEIILGRDSNLQILTRKEVEETEAIEQAN
jgi:single stranded DNA-binding protein